MSIQLSPTSKQLRSKIARAKLAGRKIEKQLRAVNGNQHPCLSGREHEGLYQLWNEAMELVAEFEKQYRMSYTADRKIHFNSLGVSL